MKKIEEETIQFVGEAMGLGAEMITATFLSKTLCEAKGKKSLGFKLGAYLTTASVSMLAGTMVKKSVDEVTSLYNSVVDLMDQTKADIIKSEMSRED